MKKFSILILVLLLVSTSSYVATSVSKISCSMQVISVANKKKVVTSGSIFYDKTTKNMISRIQNPTEVVQIFEDDGTTITYIVSSNTVSSKEVKGNISVNNVIRFAIDGNLEDMGLRKGGFTLKSSKTENGILIRNFSPPSSLSSRMSNIELAVSAGKPIYLSLQAKDKKYLSKTFYTDYINIFGLNVPQKITDISYVYNGKFKDSTITKTTFSQFKTNESVDNFFTNFKVPTNAKISFK